MKTEEIKRRFLAFFQQRGHTIVSSASLVPENDPSVLFTTAGMQQFKPYYLGLKNPIADFQSQNTVSIQKCVRTSDIDEVGDERHLTFFEMLGNFSFGGYWKREAINYAYDFIVKELGLKIDYVSVFSGENKLVTDTESEEIWKSIDPKIVVKKFGRSDNFWGPTGNEGPCGPTTEIYVNGIEIWNIVFNEFYQEQDGTLRPLETKGIDTGMGLERLAMVLQGKNNIFETDIYKLPKASSRAERIVADHIRAATALVTAGVVVSNTDRGYVLRRLIRRAVRYADVLGMPSGSLSDLPEIKREESKFRETLQKGLKEFRKGTDPFILYTTYGFPLELVQELAAEKGQKIDEAKFVQEMKKHQEISRAGAEGKFKGGLADHQPETIKLHTAHHLLLAALQRVLGKGVKQRGSNITAERLRLDFSFERKLSEEEKVAVTKLVNDWIAAALPVTRQEMPKAEAERLGAEMEFGQKYGDIVSVYSIGDVSKEFCGGPHVKNTSELKGTFKITKEEAISAGVRRIKAMLV